MSETRISAMVGLSVIEMTPPARPACRPLFLSWIGLRENSHPSRIAGLVELRARTSRYMDESLPLLSRGDGTPERTCPELAGGHIPPLLRMISGTGITMGMGR